MEDKGGEEDRVGEEDRAGEEDRTGEEDRVGRRIGVGGSFKSFFDSYGNDHCHQTPHNLLFCFSLFPLHTQEF